MAKRTKSSSRRLTDDAVLQQLFERLGGERPQLVMSDIAPNMTGSTAVDLDRSMHLIELSADFAAAKIRKPEASRQCRAELYRPAHGLKS